MKTEIYRQDKKQTLVFDINEIYRVIPEAKELEGKNFSTIKQLLKELIAKVEESGQWEFVQYVNNSPSLFVIRQNAYVVNKSEDKKKIDFFQPEVEIKNHYNQHQPLAGQSKKPKKYIKPEDFPEDFQKEQENNVDDIKIEVTKLPWEA